MEEPTSEQLLNYIDAAVNLYERVHDRSRIPTRKQIQRILQSVGVTVPLDRISASLEDLQALARGEE
jgi:hypothetical protein